MSPPSAQTRARLIAHYLPQFHPTPENDRWWGPGFTEWVPVASARPLFKGHRQPRLPADLGFYDLRLPQTRSDQAALAREHGVDGFCYWHYWFAGYRLLNVPIDEVLMLGEPEFPFCLGWANSDWTGVWVGRSRDVLIKQTYPGRDDWIAHFEQLLPFFSDPRYLRVRDRPLFYIYRPMDVPNLHDMLEEWSSRAHDAGIGPPYVVGELDLYSPVATRWARANTYLDGIVDVSWNRAFGSAQRLLRRLPGGPLRRSYLRAAQHLSSLSGEFKHVLQPCVLTGWDNTPRFGRRGVVLDDLAPQRLATVLSASMAAISHRPGNERFIWLKSWNEWAEGNILEPDRYYGRALLEAVATCAQVD